MEGRWLFWWRWLLVVSGGVVALGLVMVLAPHLTRRLFGLLLFSSSGALDAFGEPAVRYLSLVHGVLGAVMIGWGVALLSILLGAFRRGSREAWLTCTASLVAWFVPDTALSLWTGFWQNAVLNVALIVLFAIPLAATYRAFSARGS